MKPCDGAEDAGRRDLADHRVRDALVRPGFRLVRPRLHEVERTAAHQAMRLSLNVAPVESRAMTYGGAAYGTAAYGSGPNFAALQAAQRRYFATPRAHLPPQLVLSEVQEAALIDPLSDDARALLLNAAQAIVDNLDRTRGIEEQVTALSEELGSRFDALVEAISPVREEAEQVLQSLSEGPASFTSEPEAVDPLRLGLGAAVLLVSFLAATGMAVALSAGSWVGVLAFLLTWIVFMDGKIKPPTA
jgi:hypothetical protein